MKTPSEHFKHQSGTTRAPIIWVIGATRSSKSPFVQAFAHEGRAALSFDQVTSTSDYFRERYGKDDTFSREFVIELSDFSAACLREDPDCLLNHLRGVIGQARSTHIIEGERNPHMFSQLYDPRRDMVFFLHNMAMETYDTVIEPGIACIESNMRWSVNVGTTPQASVMKFTFGNDELVAERFTAQNVSPAVRDVLGMPQPSAEKRYPWMDDLLTLSQERIASYYGFALDVAPELKNTDEPSFPMKT